MLKRVNGRLMFTDTAYSVAKKFAQIYIPAVSALYFGLGNIWGFPAIEQVVGSCAVVATFVGVCIGLSSNSFSASGAGFDGEITTHHTPKGKKTYSLNLKGDPEEIDQKHTVTFKVSKT